MASPMYRASSDSRSDRQPAYSGVVKILVRSRGFDSSDQDSICSSEGEVPEMKGAWIAAEILEISPSNSTSGAL